MMMVVKLAMDHNFTHKGGIQVLSIYHTIIVKL